MLDIDGTIKLTLDNAGHVYSIEIPGWELTLDNMVEDLIKPLMRAAGFSEESVRYAFNEEESDG